jgi:hypothetical protein
MLAVCADVRVLFTFRAVTCNQIFLRVPLSLRAGFLGARKQRKEKTVHV